MTVLPLVGCREQIVAVEVLSLEDDDFSARRRGLLARLPSITLDGMDPLFQKQADPLSAKLAASPAVQTTEQVRVVPMLRHDIDVSPAAVMRCLLASSLVQQRKS